MPKYYVYDRNTGEIVHIHETVEAVSGTSLESSHEDVLALVDYADKSNLDVSEVEAPSREAERAVRVDLETRQVVLESEQ